jgi:hypothetical protein
MLKVFQNGTLLDAQTLHVSYIVKDRLARLPIQPLLAGFNIQRQPQDIVKGKLHALGSTQGRL